MENEVPKAKTKSQNKFQATLENEVIAKLHQNSVWHQRAESGMSSLEKNFRALSVKPNRSSSEEELVENVREKWNSG
jgi:hypothetical protein